MELNTFRRNFCRCGIASMPIATIPSYRKRKSCFLLVFTVRREQSFLHKNLESAEITNKKYGKPTLHSPIANHVLEMSIKLKFQCVCFEKRHCFALLVLNWFPICFY